MRLRYLAPLAMAAAAATIGLAPVAAAAPAGPCTTTGNSTVCERPGHVNITARRRWFPARSTHLSHIRCTPYSLDAEHALTLELAQATTAYWAAASRRGGHSLARLFAEASWGPSLVGAARPLSRYRAERQFTACAGSAGSEQRRRTDHHSHRRCTRTPTNRTCHTDTSSPANILI